MSMRLVNWVRWGMMGLGFIIVLVFLAFAIGNEGHGPSLLKWTPEALMTWSMLLWILSIFVGMRWIRVGALMGLASICGFYGINYAAFGQIPGGPVFPLMWIPPLTLLLTSFYLRRQGPQGPGAGGHAP